MMNDIVFWIVGLIAPFAAYIAFATSIAYRNKFNKYKVYSYPDERTGTTIYFARVMSKFLWVIPVYRVFEHYGVRRTMDMSTLETWLATSYKDWNMKNASKKIKLVKTHK